MLRFGILVLSAAPMSVHSKDAPEQIHIAFAGRVSAGNLAGMSVSWFSPSKPAQNIVQFGVSDRALDHAANGTCVKYYVGYHCHVELLDLEPATRHFYRVGSPGSGWSKVLTFKTAPSARDAAFSVAIFGDMGYEGSAERPMRIHGIGGLVSNWSADGTRATLERLSQEGKLDFVWHVGDIGYLDDSYAHEPLKFTYESDYNGYMNWLQNLSSAIPYMVLPGNHESECHSPACIANPHLGLPLKNFSAFNARWHMPSAASGGRMNMWYSFNVGNIHFVSINTETDFPGAGEENKGDSGVAWLTAGHFGENGEYLRWLEADLRAAAAERTNGGRQWILAGGHKPMFALKGSGIVELMEKYGVDVYFAGHIHSYFRSPPSTQGKVNRSGILSDSHYRTGYGIVEIVAGGAGCDEMALQAQKMTQEGSCEHGAVPGSDYCLVPVREGLPPLGAFPNAAVNTSAVSLGVLDSVNERTLHWRLIGSTTGHLLDDLMITRGDEAPEMPATRVLV